MSTEKKELKFIHITKTGGTSIENAAKNHGVQWGRFDSSLMFLGQPFWHMPFQKCPDEGSKREIIDRFDLFAVVRNPYTRCVSEYFCKWGGPDKNLRTKEQMNKYIQHKLRHMRRGGTWKLPQNKHFAPQFMYVYDGHGKRHVKHVLKFENLQEEFDALMEEYSSPVRLDRHDNVSKKNLTVADLNEDTRRLIQQVYKRDFKEFGYNM